MTLYEINEKIRVFLEENVDPETGEVLNLDLLESLEIERSEKLENYALVCKNYDAEIAVILSILLYTIISKNRVFFWSTTNIHRAKRSEYWWCSGCMTEMVTQPRLVLRNNYAV